MREIANLPDDLDPAVFLQNVVGHRRMTAALRIQAAAVLTPYRHSRRTARCILTPIDLPVPTTVAEAEANIAQLGALAAAGKIGLDEMADLVNAQRAFAEVRSDTETERRLAAIEKLLREHPQLTAVALTVLDGLPRMPGHEGLIMPSLPRRLESGNSDDNGGATP